MFAPDPNDVYPLHNFIADFASWVADGLDLRYCFVIGAGASRSSGIPTGGALVDDWLRARFKQECPGASADDCPPWAEAKFKNWVNFSWATRAGFYGQIYEWFFKDNATGQAALRRLMRDKSPSFGYSVLSNILNKSAHKVVLTTNFDNLMRDAIALYLPDCDPFVCHGEADARFLAGHSSRVRVVKIHGDIDRETYNAATQIVRLHPGWDAALRGIFTDHTPIFLGYGGNDPGLMRFLSDTLQSGQFRARPIWAYRVDPTASSQEASASAVPGGCLDTPLVHEFMARHRGMWLPIPGFDELMLLLGHALAYENLAPRIRAEADRRARDYERTLAEAVKAVRSVPAGPWCPLLSELASAAEAGLLGAVARRSWDQWRVAIEAAPSRQDEARLYQEALREPGENPELKAAYARFRADEAPNDPEVKRMVEEARSRAEMTAGPNSPALLFVKHSQATILWTQGKLEEAQTQAEEVLRAREDVLGQEHPDTLRTATLLAGVLLRRGSLEPAELLYRRTLDARDRTLGPEHPDTLWSMVGLANVLVEKHQTVEAEVILRRCVQGLERTLGPDHQQTWTAMANVAHVLARRENYVEAEKLFRQTLDACERVLGREHPDTLGMAYNLGQTLVQRNRHAAARSLFQRARDGFARVYGEDHPSARDCQAALDSLPAT